MCGWGVSLYALTASGKRWGVDAVSGSNFLHLLLTAGAGHFRGNNVRSEGHDEE